MLTCHLVLAMFTVIIFAVTFAAVATLAYNWPVGFPGVHAMVRPE